MESVLSGDREPSAKLGPRTLSARDLGLIERVEAAARAVEAAEADLVDAVRASVLAGDSWAVIGTALGISRQAAQKRFGKDWGRPSGADAPKPRDPLRAPPFERDEALRRHQANAAALQNDQRVRDLVFGDGLDQELDDGYDGERVRRLRRDAASPPPGTPAPATAPG